jgi:protein TonB
VLCHILLVILPYPAWKQATRQTELALPQIEVTWYGPIRDLPLLNPTGPVAPPRPLGEPEKPLPSRGADAYHPRQTIISAPRVPTHPRQTLIQPEAPPQAPKILPQMPNIVQWADVQPSKPKLQISKLVLAKLRPKKPAMRLQPEVPLPEVPNLEKQVGDLNIASSALAVPKPQLPVPTASVPQVGRRQVEAAPAPEIGPGPNIPSSAAAAPKPQLPVPTASVPLVSRHQVEAAPAPEIGPGPNIPSSAGTAPKPQLPVPTASVPQVGRRQTGQEAVAAPDIAPSVNSGDVGLQKMVAISPAAPALPMDNLPMAAGNLAARISISPEGPKPGVPGGSPNGTPSSAGAHPGNGGAGNGSGPSGVSISGGNANAASPTPSVSALRAPNTYPPGSPLAKSAVPAALPDPSRVSPTPGLDRLKPGAPPEEVFGPKRVYTLHVNMPNLSSVTGSWVLSFVELGQEDDQPKTPPAPADLTGPVPVRKVDPKYPASLITAKVEGEVVLYAVIRRDGTVDSIQLVRGLEPELDNNAMEALARWRFRPAERKGAAVELEAIIHIPFRAIAPSY